MDGNFKAERMKMRNPADDVKLTDGEGYFVSDTRYQEHIRTAKDYKQV
jgi:hypothetical protein